MCPDLSSFQDKSHFIDILFWVDNCSQSVRLLIIGNIGRIQRNWDITSMCTWVRFRFYQEYCTIIAQVTSIISIEFSLVYGIFAFVHINYVIYVMLLAVVAKINKWCISLCKYFVNRKSCYHIATFSWSFSYSFGRCDIEYNTVSRLFRFVVVYVLWLFVCIPTVLYVCLVPILYIWSHVRLHCILPNAIRI